MNEGIQYELEANGVALLQVHRPEARNALNWAAQQAFAAAVEEAVQTVTREPERLRVLLIAGGGTKAFVAGGDLKELVDFPSPSAGGRLNEIMGRALTRLSEIPVPVIAVVNGDAFGGGCEILTACDLRLAAAHARFSFAQVRVGLTTGWGGTGRLVRLIGQSQAMELLLTARVFDAAEAYRLGLVHRVIPGGEDVMAAARQLAADLIRLPRPALAATKTLVNTAARATLTVTAARERALFLSLWAQPDHREALSAFQEKRPPQFNQ